MELNFFNITCFVYAGFTLMTRLPIIFFQDEWNQWELNKAYRKEKPAWINIAAIFSVLFVLFSWYKAWSSNIEYGWILAVLLSITLIKISQLFFNYDQFREFAATTLYNKDKMLVINLGVFVFAIVLILMGIYLYS
jgi:hypothetical protein